MDSTASANNLFKQYPTQIDLGISLLSGALIALSPITWLNDPVSKRGIVLTTFLNTTLLGLGNKIAQTKESESFFYQNFITIAALAAGAFSAPYLASLLEGEVGLLSTYTSLSIAGYTIAIKTGIYVLCRLASFAQNFLPSLNVIPSVDSTILSKADKSAFLALLDNKEKSSTEKFAALNKIITFGIDNPPLQKDVVELILQFDNKLPDDFKQLYTFFFGLHEKKDDSRQAFLERLKNDTANTLGRMKESMLNLFKYDYQLDLFDLKDELNGHGIVHKLHCFCSMLQNDNIEALGNQPAAKILLGWILEDSIKQLTPLIDFIIAADKKLLDPERLGRPPLDALHATPEDSINENRALFMEWVSSESFDLKTLKKYSMECYIKELSGLFSTPNVILVDLKAFRKALDVVPHEKIENLVTAIPVYNTFLPMVLNHLMCDIDNRMSDVVFKPQNLKKWLKECDPTKFDFFKEKLSQYRINNYHFYFKKYCDKLLLTESHDKKVIAYLLLEAIQNLPKEQCVALFDSLAQLQPQLYSQIALSIYEPIKNILNNDPTKLMEYIKSDACDISFLISGLQSFVYSLNESPL